MDISNIFSGDKEKLTWNSASGLWEIARFKMIGIPIINIYEASAYDNELKVFLNLAMNKQILPQLKRIRWFFEKEGLPGPDIPSLKNLESTLGKLEPNAIITDEEIARCIREILKHGLDLDSHGLGQSTRKDVRELIQDFLVEDSKAYNTFIEFKKKKNWLLNPPPV